MGKRKARAAGTECRTAPIKAILQLDGYSQVQIKPKIDSAYLYTRRGAIAFTGLAGNHFARANV